MKTVSRGRRRISQALLLASAAPQVARAQSNGGAARPKTLRYALFFAAKKLLVAYAPYKFVGHRIEASVFHPWVVGFQRHPFMRDFWKYVDIDQDALDGNKA